MSTIYELRNQRAKSWNAAKAFLDAHRNEKGILSEDDAKTYEAMENEIVNLGHEIDRQERMDAMEREIAAPVSALSQSGCEPKEDKPKWHKYPDEVPDKSYQYLVTTVDDDGDHVALDRFSAAKGSWLWSEKVKAWMPIPEPFKE